MAACGQVSANSQSLRFILSLRMNSSFITSSPVGVCLCLSCRQIPQGLQDNISDIKTGVEQLKMSTKSITITMQKLSEQITSCVGNINDKPTALYKPIYVYDKRTFETLKSLSDASDSLKASFDQKTCQILKNATSIHDKGKVHHESLSQIHVQPKRKTRMAISKLMTQ